MLTCWCSLAGTESCKNCIVYKNYYGIADDAYTDTGGNWVYVHPEHDHNKDVARETMEYEYFGKNIIWKRVTKLCVCGYKWIEVFDYEYDKDGNIIKETVTRNCDE